MKGMEQELLKRLAIDVVKYQNFKLDAAINKLDYPLTNGTLKRYLSRGARYVKFGTVDKQLQKNFYTYIDAVLGQHVQPLTPSKFEKKVQYKQRYTDKEAHPPVSRLPIVNKPLTESFEYGVKYGNIIRLFNSEESMNLFLEGCKFVPNNEHIVCIRVKFEEIE